MIYTWRAGCRIYWSNRRPVVVMEPAFALPHRDSRTVMMTVDDDDDPLVSAFTDRSKDRRTKQERAPADAMLWVHGD